VFDPHNNSKRYDLTVHDRMPVILDPGSYDLWLDPGMQDVAAITELL
jgi:putative SOS response-associated peptidase YedK